MGTLHDRWLDVLAMCVTAVLLGVLYIVLAGYASGPQLGPRGVAAFNTMSESRHAGDSPAR